MLMRVFFLGVYVALGLHMWHWCSGPLQWFGLALAAIAAVLVVLVALTLIADEVLDSVIGEGGAEEMFDPSREPRR